MNILNLCRLAIVMSLFLVGALACKDASRAGETEIQEEATTGSSYKEAPFIEPAEFSEGIQRRKAVLLDVRMPQEFEQGHIKDAININFFDPNFKNQLLDLDRKKVYYVYCKNDQRSERAAEFLLQNDFPEVYVLKGGYEAWTLAGY